MKKESPNMATSGATDPDIKPKPAIEPSLTEKEVAGYYPEGSKGADEAIKEYSAAGEALKAADVAEMFRLYEKAVERSAKAGIIINGLCEHYVGSKDEPRVTAHSESAVASMERVALAAIELAKAVAGVKAS